MADSAKRSSELEIEETVIDILKKANMEETTEYKVRKMASEKLGLDLNSPELKQFVRRVVESYLDSLNSQTNQQDEDEEAAEEAEDEDQNQRKRGGQEYDDEGDLIICRLTNKRRVTISDFRGKTLVSIREYYHKDGKELPTSKGISLTTEQWSTFKKNVPAIEKAIKKMSSRG